MLRRPFRTSRRWTWDEADRLRREMNSLFTDWTGAQRTSVAPTYPAMNVWVNNDGAIVTAELPGVDPAEVDISVVQRTLTVSGNRPSEEEEGKSYHRRERGCGSFTRSFELPFEVESEGVEAVLEKGVLNITLPRAEADKPRKISIKAS